MFLLLYYENFTGNSNKTDIQFKILFSAPGAFASKQKQDVEFHTNLINLDNPIKNCTMPD